MTTTNHSSPVQQWFCCAVVKFYSLSQAEQNFYIKLHVTPYLKTRDTKTTPTPDQPIIPRTIKERTIMHFLSDIIYSDNPQRRARAEELAADIKQFEAEFKARYEAQRKELGELELPLKRLLFTLNVSSSEELHANVLKHAAGPVLEKWKTIQAKLKKDDRVDQVLSTLASVAVIGGASIHIVDWIVYLSACFSTNSLPKLISGLIAVYIATEIVSGVIIGGWMKKSYLQTEIDDTFKRRREVYHALMCQNVISGNLSTLIDVVHIVNNSEKGVDAGKKFVEEVQKKSDVTGKTVKEYEECDLNRVDQLLHKIDVVRESWMKEDPVLERNLVEG